MIKQSKSFIPPRFLIHCENLGIKLLDGDVRFIEKCLSKSPSRGHRDALMQYIEEFKQGAGGVDSNAPDVLKMNKGRFAANTWLRTAKRKP